MAVSVENEDLARAAYEEGTRRVDLQREALDSLASGAGTILAAAGVIAAFFGGQLLANDPSSAALVLSFVAVGVFLVVTVLTAFVIGARGTWRFSFDPSLLVEHYVDGAKATATARSFRNLALHRQNDYLENYSKLKRSLIVLRLATGLFGLEVLLWVVALALR